MATLIILSAILLLLLGGAIYFSNTILYPKRWTVEASYQQEVSDGKIIPADFESLPKEEIRLRSPHGYDLYGLFIPAPDSRKTVILCHGHTYTLYGSVKYIEIFRKRGYNVLLYEHRYHGRSGGPNVTFGYYEKDDLRACVDWVQERFGAGCEIGIHGESLGAAVALQHAAIDPRPTFYIADCPYASAREEFAYRLKVEYHLPAFPLLPLASWITGLRSGFTFDKAAPIAGIDQVTTPILFIHGLDDRYIPPESSLRLHERKPGLKALYLVPEARHARAYWTNRREYDRKVGLFLDSIK